MRGSRGGGGGGGQGVRTPLENHKKIGFLRSTGLDPFKNHKATKSAFNVGPSSVNGVLLAGRWWPAYSGNLILPPLIKLKNKKRRQSWNPSDKKFLRPRMPRIRLVSDSK